MSDSDFPAVDTFQGPEPLRQAYERAVKAVKERDRIVGELQGELRGHRISQAGFPDGSEAHKLLSDFYQGDLADQKAILEFAGRYGFQPGKPAQSNAPEPDATETADRTAADLLGGGAPVLPESEAARLAAEVAKAESEHRVKDALRLKNQLHALLAQSGQKK